MISQDKLREIIDQTDIVSLVGEFVSLERKGRNYMALCPFHQEKTPSFSVSPAKKIAKCMGCGEGGNPITFLQKIEGLSFEQAAKKLADRVGVTLELDVSSKPQVKKNRSHDILDIAAEFYTYNLRQTETGEKARSYLKNRDIDEAIIKTFHLGLAPATGDNLARLLASRGYETQELIDAGVVGQYEERIYDLFTHRIMFPIHDENRFIVGFSGRIFEENQKKEPKYINSPENVVFKKGNILYNYANALPHIKRKKRVILCEGFMDVIALHKAGIDEAVCSMGTALTAYQAKLLKRATQHVVLLFDGDNAGIKAVSSAIPILEKTGINVSIFLLPNQMDPDDYIKHSGVDSFLKALAEQQMDALEFNYLIAKNDLNVKSASSVDLFRRELTKLMSSKSQIVKEIYLKRAASDLGVSVESLYLDLNRHRPKGEQKQEAPSAPIKKTTIPRKFINAERRLIEYMLAQPETVRRIEKELHMSNVVLQIHYDLRQLIADEYYKRYQTMDYEILMDMMDEPTRRYFELNFLANRNLSGMVYSDKEMKECIHLIKKNYHLYSEEAKLREQLKLTKSDFEKVKIATDRDKIITEGRSK